MLKVSENSKVELTFVDFKVEYHGECAYDFVEGTYYDNMILPFLYITVLALSGAQEMQNLCLFSPSLSKLKLPILIFYFRLRFFFSIFGGAIG